MFIWRLDREVWITFQIDHMAQAGDIGAAWGGGDFGDPSHRVAVVNAARNHDEGWRRWELAPDIDHSTALPFDFKEVDRRKHAQFYGLGVDFIETINPHAALLISKHATGLYQGRYGVDGLRVTPIEELPEHSRSFIKFEEARQARLRDELRLSEADIWRDYRLLQIWDRMSIFLCHGMKSVECGPVPLEDDTLGATLTVARLDQLTARVTPFPFAQDELHVPVRMFRLSRRNFNTRDEWDEELARTPAKVANFRLVR